MKKAGLMARAASVVFACALLFGAFSVPSSAKDLNRFTDLPLMPWYESYLNRALDLGFFSGTSATTFSPNRGITRAEAVVVLSKVHEKLTGEKLGQSPAAGFSDVSPKSYYSKAVDWAKDNKIVSGKGNNSFAPKQVVTHSELAVMFHKYLSLVGKSDLYRPVTGAFENDAQLPAWAKPHIEAISGFEIFDTYWDGSFSPKKVTLRDEAVALFVRLYEKAAYPVDSETPRQSCEYCISADDNGTLIPFLPLGGEHSKVIANYEEYVQLLDTLQDNMGYKEIPQPASLTISEALFAESALLAVEVQEDEPAFRCDFGNLTIEGNTANVTLIESNRGGSAAGSKGILFFVAVPKSIESVNITRLNWTEETDWLF